MKLKCSAHNSQKTTTGLPFKICHIYFMANFRKTYITFPFIYICLLKEKLKLQNWKVYQTTLLWSSHTRCESSVDCVVWW